MNRAKQPRTRLKREDWIDSALEVLVEDGVGAVTIDRLAQRLGVTRGSFYHHFDGRQSLLDALLKNWADSTTYEILDRIEKLRLDPATSLLALLRTIRSEGAARFDAVFRAWALHDARAAEVFKEVDANRQELVRSLFAALGFEGIDLENRARLFYYYEVADAMFLEQDEPMSEERLLERVRFLTAGQPGQGAPD